MLLLGDCNDHLKDIADNSIDLTITSPPYDDLRTYGGHSFEFESVAKELYRVTKGGGVVVWIIGDSTNEGTESLTSFKQIIRFSEIGFNVHDTMIYEKANFSKPSFNRYHQIFEYMFILSKGKPKTFNPLKDRRNSYAGASHYGSGYREPEGHISERTPTTIYKAFGMRFNIWRYNNGFNQGSKDEIAYKHPAPFPEQLARDHIISWSNEGDLILDPFAGSGTTLKAAHQLGRKWIGIEKNPEYAQIIKKRLADPLAQLKLTAFA